MCTECAERPVKVKGLCHRCDARERARVKNGQVGPFTCPDCGVETRAFKDWSGARCSECSYKIRLARLKESKSTLEGKARAKLHAQKHGWTQTDEARRRLYVQRPEVRLREQQRGHNRRAVRLAQTEIGYVSPTFGLASTLLRVASALSAPSP